MNNKKLKISKSYRWGGGIKDNIKHYYSFILADGSKYNVELTEDEISSGSVYTIAKDKLRKMIYK